METSPRSRDAKTGGRPRPRPGPERDAWAEDAAATVKRTLIGRPRATGELGSTLLSKKLALPVFASDPLSSVAYATEAALVVLVGASLAASSLVLPVSVAIAVLLAVVVVSYGQTVRAYETSGGAYVVARENLGRLPSLVAAAALLVDYVLTVAVSVTAGTLALVSAFPALGNHRVELSLVFVALLTLVNLRGVREAGALFALPTYAFVAAMLAMIGTGLGRCAVGGCPTAEAPSPVPAGSGSVTVLVLLGAFASGAAALTGVEATSNGVDAFRPPRGRNAALTLAAMGAIAITLLLGVSYLAVAMDARPSETVSLVSEIARAAFPASSASAGGYYVVQALTLAILVLAANTSYQGFPRLAAALARDQNFPRQFVNLGDRLVYSNGIVVLAGVASALVWIFHADVIALTHLYVIGVFTAFTLSQAGMVRHWLRSADPHRRRRALVNGSGAVATGIVTLIVIEAKLTAGAWLVLVAVPALVGLSLLVHRHYRAVGRRLRADAVAVRAAPAASNTTVVFVESLDQAAERAVWYATAIGGTYRPVTVRDGRPAVSRARWRKAFADAPPLDVLAAVDGPVDEVVEYVWELPRGETQFVTVVVPELFRRESLLEAVTHRTTFGLKLRLLSELGVAICDVPLVEGREPAAPPERAAVRVLVSGVHAASLRAIRYATTLGLADARAVFFAFDSAETRTFRRQWERAGAGLPLDVVEAPFRDLGHPLLAYLRELTADQGTVVSVIMPELVFSGWQRLLHNQRALYLKRLLLFEPQVILTSVPYRLR